MKRLGIYSILSFALFFLTASELRSAELSELRINYGAVSAAYTPVWVGHEEGLFAKYGFKTDPRLIGAATEVQALLGGSLDIINGGPELVDTRLQGGDVVYIAGMVNRFVFSLYSKPDLQKFGDLKGKAIGATQPNSSTDFAVRILLKEAGLVPGKDVNILYVKGVPEILAAILQGTVAAGVLSPPTTLKARQAGLKELVNITDKNIPSIQASVGTTGDFIKKRPDAVKRYLQAYIEALKFIRSEPVRTKKAISKYTNTNNQEDLDESYRAFEVAWERVPSMSPAAIQTLLDFSQNPAAKSAKASQFINNSFIAELDRSGFIDQVYGRPGR
jgi:ABC-type nitrate/sulfonate/bicarbonate transport system substrate-binding protein